MTSYIEPDRVYLVALALSGVLEEDQTREVLESVTFKGNRIESGFLNQFCERLRAETPVERLARAHKGTA